MSGLRPAPHPRCTAAAAQAPRARAPTQQCGRLVDHLAIRLPRCTAPSGACTECRRVRPRTEYRLNPCTEKVRLYSPGQPYNTSCGQNTLPFLAGSTSKRPGACRAGGGNARITIKTPLMQTVLTMHTSRTCPGSEAGGGRLPPKGGIMMMRCSHVAGRPPSIHGLKGRRHTACACVDY